MVVQIGGALPGVLTVTDERQYRYRDEVEGGAEAAVVYVLAGAEASDLAAVASAVAERPQLRTALDALFTELPVQPRVSPLRGGGEYGSFSASSADPEEEYVATSPGSVASSSAFAPVLGARALSLYAAALETWHRMWGSG